MSEPRTGRTLRTGAVIATLMLSSTPVVGQAPAAAPSASTSAQPWMNAAIAPARRVALLLPQMTRAEKQLMVMGYFATDFPPKKFKAPADARNGSAGYVPGVPRLGIPPQWQADAGIGVASQGGAPPSANGPPSPPTWRSQRRGTSRSPGAGVP